MQNNRNVHWEETPGLSNLSLERGSFPTLEQVSHGLVELELENFQVKRLYNLPGQHVRKSKSRYKKTKPCILQD